MRGWNRSTRVWDGPTAVFFSVSACIVCWGLFTAGWVGRDLTITIRPLQFVIDTSSFLLNAAILLPALYCFVTYPECRSSVWRVNASWKVYTAAVVTGFSLPFTSYIGTHSPAFPWGYPVVIQLVAAFAKGLYGAPLWEEIVWRGCFLKKIKSLTAAPSAILLMSLGWTMWHGAKIAFFYSRGIPTKALIIFVFTIFLTGILLGAVFELGSESIWPSALMHSAFNAATLTYYSQYDRMSELGSYLAELVFVVIAAGWSLRAVIRATRMQVGAGRSGSD